MSTSADPDYLRSLLCDLQDSIRDALLAARTQNDATEFARVAGQTSADTIYAIDRVSEEAIMEWFARQWPTSEPVELVMEGLEDGESVCFPDSVRVEDTKWKCILDPIDGTRGIMYDKRSAWSLAALAPQKGEATDLRDITIAAMSELPTSKAYLADQVSGVRGCGRDGLVCERINVLDGSKTAWIPQPSTAQDFRHGFAALARFFPEGKALMAGVEEELWDELIGLNSSPSPVIFDDQYISTGGQMFEILVGHDRMQGDLRPLAYARLGFDSSLVCHPYDICTAFLLQEAGGIVEAPDGTALSAPLDTTSSVVWMAFANETLAEQVRPVLRRLVKEHF
ncbi:inositol monophosphatase [bacterium]|nr:MAG: inositol monophosphatase [bacterium]